MDWATFIKISHIIGTVVGVGATTFSQILYFKFLGSKENSLIADEVLSLFYKMIRLGTVILVFSGFGYLILWRLKYLGPDVFFSDRFLAKISVFLILLLIAFALNFKLINPKVGSAIAFSSWYAVMVLGAWRSIPYSFTAIIVGYLVFTFIVYWIFEYFTKMILKKDK